MFTSLPLLMLCFSKPYRMILMFFALALAFECIFKLLFLNRTQKQKINKFYTNYLQVKDRRTGETINRYVPPEQRKYYEKVDVNQKYAKFLFNRNNLVMRLTEVLVAAFMSVALHSMAYDVGDKYDNMDLSQHESLIHANMKQKVNDYSENELDFVNYFFRKLFYHLMSRKGEDNFSILLFK